MDTLQILRDEVLGWIDEVGDSGDTADKVDNALRQAHHLRCTEHPWRFMLYPKQRFTLAASTISYTLHPLFHRPLYFYNVTQTQFLEETPARQLDDFDIDFINSVSDTAFRLEGTAAVAAQPSSASVVTLVSTDATDTGSAKAVTIRGETTSGIETETLTPTGTTPVAGTKSFTTIINVTVAGVWAGTLTLTSNSAAVTVLRLVAGELGRQHQQMRLLWTPSGGDIIEYQFYRSPSPFSADNDIPDIPFPHSKILVWDALLLMAAYDDQVEPGRVRVWERKQQELDNSLRNAYLEPQSLQSRRRFVKYRGD
jgi:hypothetical protein